MSYQQDQPPQAWQWQQNTSYSQYQQPHYQHYPPYKQYQTPYPMYYPPPPLAKPKNRGMKIAAIVCLSISLFLMLFAATPTIGVVFGFLAFFVDVLGLVFVCCI